MPVSLVSSSGASPPDFHKSFDVYEDLDFGLDEDMDEQTGTDGSN